MGATLVALFMPYFGDLTAITSAVGLTPLSFLLPMMFWNKKNETTAPRWRVRLHYAFMVVFILLSLMALIGAIGDRPYKWAARGPPRLRCSVSPSNSAPQEEIAS